MALSVYSRTLQKAAELIGGRTKLCRYLQVPADELQKWIDDRQRPPTQVFLRVVDLILEETPPPAESSPAEPPAPRDCAAGGSSSSTCY